MVGETPNLAARLQALAAPGSVVISQATRRLVGGLFELDDLGPQRLKGFAEPLAAWRVAGESRAEGRFEARQSAGPDAAGRPRRGDRPAAAPLAAGAATARARWCCSRASPGSASRVSCASCATRLDGEPHIRLLYQCSPHHTTSPLHPVIEQLERAAGFERDDPPAAKLDKLEALLARGTDQLDQAVPLIAALLGVPTGESLPAARPDPAAPEAAHAGGAGRPARGARGGAAGAAGLRGRALDRSDHAGAAGPDDRAHPAPAGAAADHLPAGVHAALVGSAARQRAGADPARPARGRGHGRAGGPGQGRCRTRSRRRSWPRPTACRCSSRS